MRDVNRNLGSNDTASDRELTTDGLGGIVSKPKCSTKKPQGWDDNIH